MKQNFTHIKPKVLDLFCGPGGASFGLNACGFECVGIDIKEQDYPFKFIKSDVFDLPIEFFKDFDLIWSSPPCQGYIDCNINKPNYLRLIEPVRKLLKNIKKPYVIENVQLAPIRHDLMLCGEMFNLKVIRHRYFEIEGFNVLPIKHIKHKGTVANGNYIACYNGSPGNPRTIMKYKTKSAKPQEMANALNITWTTKNITECIPPAYSKYIGGFYKL